MAYFAAVPVETLSDEELSRRSKALYQIGSVRIAQGNLEAASKPLEESLDLAKALVDAEPHRRRTPVRAGPEPLLGRGRPLAPEGPGRRAGALPSLQRHRRTARRARTPAGRTGASSWRPRTATSAPCCRNGDDSDGALAQFRACLAIERGLLDQDPDNNAFGKRWPRPTTRSARSRGLEDVWQEALEHHRTELTIREELVRREPGNAPWRMYLGVSHHEVGVVLEAIGDVASALDALPDSRSPSPRGWPPTTRRTWSGSASSPGTTSGSAARSGLGRARAPSCHGTCRPRWPS